VADAWYYTSQGQQQGPASTEELRRYATRGLLRPRDLAWKDGMRRWVPAYTVPEFGLRPPRPGGADFGADPDAAGLSPAGRAAVWLGVFGGLAGVVAVVVFLVRSAQPAVAMNYEQHLEPGRQYSWPVELHAGQRVEVSLVGQGTTNVSLRVYDAARWRLVAEDSGGFTDRRRLVWTPSVTQTYRITVENHDPQRSNIVKVSVR
jgi:hypothetical protein